ncbi:MAG: transcription termination factor NusA [bacterium]|nr:transcription termination factor NusA [bacterium]
MNTEIIEAVTQIAKERNIKREALSGIIESIFVSMIKRKFGTSDNFNVFVNMDKGEVEIYQVKNIVEEVSDPVTQVSVERAKETEPDLDLGDEFVEMIDPMSFGRRLITSAKQSLTQKIREAEKEVLFNEFKDRVGEVVVGDIRQNNRDEVLISVDHMEVTLPRSEQIHNEHYHRGDTVRAVIKEVSQTSRGPEVIVSRTDPKFLIRLFELEVPEIYDGVIEIKGVARFPGDRAKVAVYSNDKRIDAVGACVGLKGVRIQSIVKELNNEKIDVINWSSEPEIFISRALSPAKPVRIILNNEQKSATAVISDDQISLAIGKGGQNRQLACMLTGYAVETVKQSDWDKSQPKEEKLLLSDIPELTKTIVEKLAAAGFESAEEVLDAGRETILELKGFGDKTADRIFEVLASYYEDEPLKDRGTGIESGTAPEAGRPEPDAAGTESVEPRPESSVEPQPEEESKPAGDAR